jgi:hypothetical protein
MGSSSPSPARGALERDGPDDEGCPRQRDGDHGDEHHGARAPAIRIVRLLVTDHAAGGGAEDPPAGAGRTRRRRAPR